MSTQVNSFSLKDYVASVSKTAEETIASKNIPPSQELEVYINAFEESLAETQRMRGSVQERIQQLEASLYQDDGGLANDSYRLVTAFEREFGLFETLEKRFDAIGSTAIRAGQQIERLRAERLRAIEAQELVKAYMEVCRLPEPTMLKLEGSILEGPSADIRKAGVLRLRRLVSLSKSLSAGEANERIALAAQRVENALLERFHAAFDADDRAMMREPASLLIAFNGGGSCIGSFIGKHAFFLDPTTPGLVRTRYTDPNCVIDFSAEEPVDSAISEMFKAILDTVEEDWRFMEEVFETPGAVMNGLLTRILQEPVQVIIEAGLKQARAHSRYAFLRALAATMKAARGLGKDLQRLFERLVIGHCPAQQLLESLFSPYLATLADEECAALAKTFAIAFNPCHVAVAAKKTASRSFLRSSTGAAPVPIDISGIRWFFGQMPLIAANEGSDCLPPAGVVKRCLTIFNEAMARLYALLEEDQRGPALEKLYALCFHSVTELIALCLETPMEADAFDSGLDPVHLSIAAASTCILAMLQQAHQTIAAPLLVSAAPSSFRSAVLLKDKLFGAKAGKIDALLKREVAAWLTHIEEGLLSKQRSSDYKPRDDELTMGVTQTCEKVVKFVKDAIKCTKETLEEENARLVLSEFGRSFHSILLGHMKRFSISEMGALALRNDLRAYLETIEQMGPASKALLPSFQILCDLGNIFLMRPENLRSYLQEGTMALLDTRFSFPFVAQRADFRSAKLERIFPELAQNSTLAAFFSLNQHDLA